LAKARESAKGIPSVARLKVLSRKWNWVGRCYAYDDYLELQDRLQQQKQRREMNERHAKVGQFSQTVALRRLEKLVRDIEDGKSTMSGADAARLLQIGVQIERIARGAPTDVQENVGPDGGRIEIDRRPFIRAVREALGFRDNVELGPLKMVFSTSDRNLLTANEGTDSLKRFEETPDQRSEPPKPVD
jgi:hypothetical protein